MVIPTLETPRLRLRPYRPDDFEVFAEMNGDADVMRYIDKPQDRAAAFRSFCATIGHWTARGYGSWIAEKKDTGLVVARAGIYDWEGNPGLEVGYAVRKGHWGKGYATELARESLRYAHEVLKVRGVISVIAPGNVASIRVAEKLGARVGRKQMLRGEEVLIFVHPDP